MLKLLGLQKRFGDVRAVEDVSFEAQDGSVTGLLGPNGAGKTTTLRMISGLVWPDAGDVEVDGLSVRAAPFEVQKRLGVLPDAKGLYPRLTAREHIRYFAQLHAMSTQQAEQRTEALIERLEMRQIADRRTAGFSQGERMKVSLARALVHDPRNLLLDEPTNGLDVMATRATRQLIQGLRADGHCVVFSSHIMQEVAAVCDRIVVMAAGRVAAQGTAEELTAQAGCQGLEEAFVILAGLGASGVAS